MFVRLPKWRLRAAIARRSVPRLGASGGGRAASAVEHDENAGGDDDDAHRQDRNGAQDLDHLCLPRECLSQLHRFRFNDASIVAVLPEGTVSAVPPVTGFQPVGRIPRKKNARAGGSTGVRLAGSGEERGELTAARRLREEHDEDAGGDDDGAHGNDGTGTKELDHLTLHEGPGGRASL